jgi:hypothetical protein
MKNKWKEAIEEQLEICGLDCLDCKDDPKKALEHLIGYNFESGYKECERRNIWKEAVIEELITWHIYSYEHENNPKKALHDLAVINSDVAVYFHEQEKWNKKLKNKALEVWYRTPLPYWLYKIAKIQPPF